jgi:hypothetical protein
MKIRSTSTLPRQARSRADAKNQAVFTSASGHPIYRWRCSLGKNRCPPSWRLFSSDARQPARTGERIRAANAAGGIGRRGQFGDQRRALRSRQSKRAQRPSGIGNASRTPPLGRNSPPPPVVYGSVGSPPSRVVAPYAGASQRIFSADQVDSRRPPVRRRGRPQVRKFTGIWPGILVEVEAVAAKA